MSDLDKTKYKEIEETKIKEIKLEETKIKEIKTEEAITSESEKHDKYYEEKIKIPKIGEDGIIEGDFSDMADSYNQQSNDSKVHYYSETISNEKPKNNTSSFKRFIATVLIASIVGGPMIGVGMGLAKPIAENLLIPMITQKETTQKENFAFNKDTIAEATQLSTNIENTSVSPASVISKNVGPSVIGITSTISVADFFNRATDTQSSGSGIIFNEDNDKIYIVTNNHVIDGAKTVVVTLSGDQKIQANLVGTDLETDLAVISVNKSDMTPESLSKVVIAKFGDSSELQVGELAVAIGNPLGEQFSNSVTQGIISGLDRKISTTDREYTVIQTDAAINTGNSGGALVNSKSEVIGINTIKLTSGVEGMGFAIPTNIAKPIIEELMNKGYISRPYLGILMQVVTEQDSQMYDIPVGIMVVNVVEGSGASIAGIQQGDIITNFDGEKITSTEQLSQLIKKHKTGDKVAIKLMRNGKIPLEVNVVLQDSGTKSQVTATPQKAQNNQQGQNYYYFGN